MGDEDGAGGFPGVFDEAINRLDEGEDAEIENGAEAFAGMPEVGVVEECVEAAGVAEFDVLEAGVEDVVSEGTVGGQGDAVAALAEGGADADEGKNVAGAADGEEEDLHIRVAFRRKKSLGCPLPLTDHLSYLTGRSKAGAVVAMAESSPRGRQGGYDTWLVLFFTSYRSIPMESSVMPNRKRYIKPLIVAAAMAAFFVCWEAFAGESNLVLPDKAAFQNIVFLHRAINGYNLLLCGLGVCVLGLLFGLFFYQRLRKLPVHKSMLEISELIYATCKTYLLTQIKFILMLELFIGTIIVVYFGLLSPETHGQWGRVAIILLFSLIGIAGSCSVAAFGIRINTFANSRARWRRWRASPTPATPSLSRPA